MKNNTLHVCMVTMIIMVWRNTLLRTVLLKEDLNYLLLDIRELNPLIRSIIAPLYNITVLMTMNHTALNGSISCI